MTIQSLVDKQDTFEIIRDKIAEILVTETTSQQVLATAGGKDPELWRLRVFTERSNAWETWLNNSDDLAPIVNVWYDRSTFDPAGSNVVKSQKTIGLFNIDCLGYAKSADNPGGGHTPGDQEAVFVAQRALRLARNWLMASENIYLGLRKTVWQRWTESTEVFQVLGADRRPIQQIVGARLALRVTFTEFSPQYEAEALEYVSITVRRTEDGEILVVTDFDYS